MDSNLVKTLEQLEAKKNAVNAEADLSKECESIIELDRRIGLLLDEIKVLRSNIEKESRFIGGICGRLTYSYKTLYQTSEIFDIVLRLLKLNKICHHMDSSALFRIPALTSQQPPTPSLPQQSTATSSDELSTDNNDTINQYRMEMIKEFEAAYAPLESILNERWDLPYVTYANIARTMKLSLDNDATKNK